MVPLSSTTLIITPLNITKEAKNALHGAQFQIPVVFLQIFQKIPGRLRGPGNHDYQTKKYDNIFEIIFMVFTWNSFFFFVSKIVKIVKIAKIVENCSKIMKKIIKMFRQTKKYSRIEKIANFDQKWLTHSFQWCKRLTLCNFNYRKFRKIGKFEIFKRNFRAIYEN